MPTQLAFLLLAVKLSEQLQGGSLSCVESTHQAAQSPISEPGVPSGSDQIWILCHAALLGLVTPVGTNERQHVPRRSLVYAELPRWSARWRHGGKHFCFSPPSPDCSLQLSEVPPSSGRLQFRLLLPEAGLQVLPDTQRLTLPMTAHPALPRLRERETTQSAPNEGRLYHYSIAM